MGQAWSCLPFLIYQKTGWQKIILDLVSRLNIGELVLKTSRKSNKRQKFQHYTVTKLRLAREQTDHQVHMGAPSHCYTCAGGDEFLENWGGWGVMDEAARGFRLHPTSISYVCWSPCAFKIQMHLGFTMCDFLASTVEMHMVINGNLQMQNYAFGTHLCWSPYAFKIQMYTVRQ